MIKKSNFLLILTLLLALTSCTKKSVFNEYQSLGESWDKDSIVSFSFEQKDTLKPYNLFINVRNNKNYEFNNLFLIVAMEQPDKKTIIDTFEYQMTNSDGSFLGTGFSDLKENKLFYKEKTKFKNSGTYNVFIQQAVRRTGKVVGEKALEGITDVGFSIETIE